jgi:hypothetical protein
MGQKEKLNELQGKLDQIFDGLDDYYSQAILDELIIRIDSTINEFNKDFKSMISNLNKSPENDQNPVKQTSTDKKSSPTPKARSTKSRVKL